jgi:uncharacterized repeat protein (TIGR01451 family)
MLSVKSLLATALCLLFISNISNAVMCARLKSVSAGEDHTLALMDDNTLWACGGSNGDYQLGIGGNAYNVLSLQQVKGENGVGFLRNVVSFDAGWYHSLAADTNGVCYSWGKNTSGQLGGGSPSIVPYWDVPREVNGVGGVGHLPHIVYVSAGRSGTHSLAVDSNGYVYAWGNNYYGQCGDGNTGGRRDYPVLVLDSNSQTTGRYLGDETHVIAVDAGMYHSLALDANGHVWHWGRYSQSGNYPEKVKTSSGEVLSNIVQISSCYYSIAVDSNDNVWEWDYSDSAYKVPGGEMGTSYLEDIVEVSAGYNYPDSMARTIYGYVLVWSAGQNAYPEYVTDGEMETKSGLVEGIISINAGYYDHKLAVCENGFGWAWGTNNSYGQFGVGDDNQHPEPTQMLCTEDPNSILLTKTDEIQGSDPNCALPGDVITYTITYDANGHSDSNVVITDYLPEEVTYLDVEIEEPFFLICNYDEEQHVFVWDIGDVGPNETNSIGIIVQVNNLAEPLGELRNRAILEGDTSFNVAEITTPVCCWDPGVIYVDSDRWGGANTGMSWDNAYRDLNDALSRARHGCGSEIWVAEGTYKPKPSGATFQLVNGIPVYGHFAGNETSINQRNLHNPNNETILTGLLNDYPIYAYYVVTASNVGAATILDGFTITEGYDSGIAVTGNGPTITNCIIHNNGAGISGNNANLKVNHCIISDNSGNGVHITNSNPVSMTFTNNHIHNNQASGIYIYEYYYPGSSQITIRNNTITRNTGYGIYVVSIVQPNITNCIVWGNSNDLAGCTASYSWLDANGDPCFMNTNEPNEYHLGPNSPCIDTGDPCFIDFNETDIDGECRIMFGKTALRVDIGADENYWSRADYNRDEVVNFIDYAKLAGAWRTVNPAYSLDGDTDVDINDLAVFCDDWLWLAPWSELYETLMSQGGDGMAMQSMADETTIPELLELTPQPAAESADLSAPYVEPAVETKADMIERLVNWLDDVWLTGGLSDIMTEQEYLAFRQAIAESVEAE